MSREPEPPTQTAKPARLPRPADDPDFHCPNCRWLETRSGQGFWACQNRCVRD